MKKAILFLAMLVFTQVVFGQFKLTPNNYVSESNPDKNYIVLEFPGKSQKELFIDAKKYFTSKFERLKGQGYNEVENEQLVLDVNSRIVVAVAYYKSGYWDLLNRYEINFKDEKLMIRPRFITLEYDDTRIKLEDLFSERWDKKTQENHEFAVWRIKEEVNKFVKDFKEGVDKKEDW